MKKIITSLGIGLTLIMSGCKTMGDHELAPAIIGQSSPDTIMAVTKAVSTAMEGKSVNIEESVFTKTNELVVMENTQSMIGNAPINGSIRTRPQHFTLMLRGKECYLVHEETGQEYILENVECTRMQPN